MCTIMVKQYLGKNSLHVIEQLYKDQLGRHRIPVVKNEANEVYDFEVYFEVFNQYQ